MASRHRILLIAEAANPEWVSVPLVGWSLYEALSKVVDVHLVSHARNQGALTRAGLIEGQHFSVVDNDNVAGPLWAASTLLRGGEGKGWTTVSAFSALAYYSFELAVWNKFREQLVLGAFDLVHRVTPLSPTHQSLIAKKLAKLGVPFIVGPLNGGLPWPKHFIDRQHSEREWLSHVRSVYKLMPGYRSMYKHSSAIIVGSKHTLSEIPGWARHKAVYIPENGISSVSSELLDSKPKNRKLRVVFVGRLVPYKGADVLLEATKEFLREGLLEVLIVGDGPERSKLEAYTRAGDLTESVHFRGWLTHAEVLEVMMSCDLLALPSIREFGGGVVIEAMSVGLPALVADYGGPSELVNKRTGFKIAFRDKASLISGIQRAVADIIEAPQILRELGKEGRDNVLKKLTWKAKAAQVVRIYDAVKGGRGELQSLSLEI